MYKVVVIDDHKLLRDMLVENINNENDFEVIGVDTDAKNSVSLCENLHPNK